MFYCLKYICVEFSKYVLWKWNFYFFFIYELFYKFFFRINLIVCILIVFMFIYSKFIRNSFLLINKIFLDILIILNVLVFI